MIVVCKRRGKCSEQHHQDNKKASKKISNGSVTTKRVGTVLSGMKDIFLCVVPVINNGGKGPSGNGGPDPHLCTCLLLVSTRVSPSKVA